MPANLPSETQLSLVESSPSCLTERRVKAVSFLVYRPDAGLVTVFAFRDDQEPADRGWFDICDLADPENEDWSWMSDEIFDNLDQEAILALPSDQETQRAQALFRLNGKWTPKATSVAPAMVFRCLERTNEAFITDLDPSLPTVPCYPLRTVDPPWDRYFIGPIRIVTLRDQLFCRPCDDYPTDWVRKVLRFWQPLAHPHIVRLAGLLHDHEGRILAILSEFAPRGCPHEVENLREPVLLRLDWIVQIVSALEYIASLGFEYTDIKPQNVVVFDGQTCSSPPFVKLIDFDGNHTDGYWHPDVASFGLAKIVEEVALPGAEGAVREKLLDLVHRAKERTMDRSVFVGHM